MTIRINQAELESIEQLPENIQTLLTMIPNSSQWVQIMIDDKKNSVSFPSMDAFITQLNVGLRGTSLLYFDNINVTVDVKKLLEMSASDLRDMSHFSNEITADQGANQKRASSQLLEKYGIVSDDDFTSISQFFQQQQVPNSSLNWSASLGDNIIFYDTLQYCESRFQVGQNIKQQALKWANGKAQTLGELAHYYCFYLAWVSNTNERLQPIEDVLALLSPLVLDNLDCPLVTFELDQRTLHDAITQWSDAGKTLGFTSYSAGLLNLILNIDLTQIDQIKQQAEEYIRQLQQQLSDHLATDSFIDQAGQYRHYIFALPNKATMLNVDSIGCLSLCVDRPKAADSANNTAPSP
ncbi:hypothetical protein CBF23_008920 [Marinomonas agarivorans]|nr:hypothetical protein CBF23_008920 [Marinomonas agarivorans]